MAGNCSRPMSPFGRSGLSQVNHIYPISRSDEGRVELELENKCIQKDNDANIE